MRMVDEHAREVNDAVEAATAECMAQKGFKYTPVEYVPRRPDVVRYGDLDLAAMNGFGLFDGGSRDASLTNEDVAGLSETEAEAWHKALAGEPVAADSLGDPDVVAIPVTDGGTLAFRRGTCRANALEKVYGDVKEWRTLESRVEEIVSSVYNAVTQDDEWAGAVRVWAACLISDGYKDYSGAGRHAFVEDAYNDIAAKKLPDDESKVLEREYAVASATCERDAGMAELYARLQPKYEQDIADREQGTITRFLELVNGAANGVNK